MSTIENYVIYKDKTYNFKDESSRVVFFNIAIFNNMDDRYDMDTVLAFVELAHACYLKDDNHTPIGALGDYIAENWEDIKDKPLRDILENFYWTII